MADVAFSGWASAAGEGVSSVNPSGLEASGTDLYLSAVACETDASAPADPSNVRWNSSSAGTGFALSKIGSTYTVPNTVTAKLAIYGLTAPSAATAALFADWPGTQAAAALGGACFSGVDQGAPRGTRISNSGDISNDPSLALTGGDVGDMYHVVMWGMGSSAGNNGTANVTVSAIPIDPEQYQTIDDYNNGEFSTTNMVFAQAYVPGNGTIRTISFTQAQPLAGWYVVAEVLKKISSGTSLVGTGISTAQGAISSSSVKALAGQAVAIGQDTLAPTTAKTLSGALSAVEQGTITPAIALTLTGHEIPVTLGTISPNDQEGDTLDGESIGVAQGSIAPAASIPITGQAVALEQASIAPAISITLSGQVIPCGLGSVSVGEDIGYSLKIDLGSAHAAVSLTLSGHDIGVSLGTLTPDSNESIGGYLSAKVILRSSMKAIFVSLPSIDADIHIAPEGLQ